MKKLITLICLMLIVSMDSMAGTKTVFMKPNSNWTQASAIFKLYMYEEGTDNKAWADFSAVSGDDGYYTATFNEEYDHMILVRLDPNGTSADPWDFDWNQSNNLEAPASDNLLYTIPDDAWSTFNPTTSNYYASITSVDVRYDLGGWSTSPLVLTETSTNVYTGVLTLTNTLADQNFKVVINGEVWIGNNSGATLVDEGSLVDATTDETNHNYILKNVEKTYKTYDVTVQWTPARIISNAAKYTITISGKDARSNETKSVTFVEGTNSWENVYAYVYYPVTSTEDSHAGYDGWHGQNITSSKSTTNIGGTDYNVYTFSCKEYEGCPLKVIFNDNTTNQTAAFELVDGKQYKYGLPAGQYVLAGDNTNVFPNGWDAESSTQVLTDNGDGTYSYSIKDVALAANASFGFKVVDIANSALVWYPASNVTYTVKDAATYDFDITFDTNPETPTVGVTGKRQVVIDAAGFTSFSSGHDLDWSAVENAAPYMATLTGETGYRKALLSKVTATEAGQGALIKGTPNATVKPIIKDVTNSFEGNLFVATNGTAISASTDGSYNYVYSSKDKLGNDNPGFYKLTSNLAEGKVKAYGAYLQTTEPLAEEAASRVSWIFDDEVTGINQIENTQPATVKNTVVYNLNGQRVMNPAKGLYIVNGKKVIIK